ncbi:hypothetical protein A4S05_37260 [Nostoc sp. KVJ20]|uniref:hypothetical protein n=1 Tax=Nostoc sp. KVJ20 TaxID=457944 RepID=UPI00083DB09E|nr:hypothetical protein [Nostoc sp. KVJ20]ODG99637.1 hypothetical protein A4S05_37260 [Nostoc sp. KVJ20]
MIWLSWGRDDDRTIRNSQFAIRIDGEFAYIEVEGRQVLNKLGGIVLPEVAINPELLIQSILKGENND